MINLTAGQAHALALWIRDNVRAPDFDTDERGIPALSLDTSSSKLFAASGNLNEAEFNRRGMLQ